MTADIVQAHTDFMDTGQVEQAGARAAAAPSGRLATGQSAKEM